MNREALFSDGTEYFRCPSEPKVGEAVTIRIRGDHNDPLEVHLCTNESRYPMGYVETRGMFSYYQVKISLKDTPITYYFEIDGG